MNGFKIQDLIDYLEKTNEDDWIVDRVRKSAEEKKGCVMSHIFDFGGGDERDESGFTKGGNAWDFFEEVFATTYMIYPVNDGENKKYQQKTAKERCIAYIKDLRDGKEKTTQDYLKEDELRFNPTKNKLTL